MFWEEFWPQLSATVIGVCLGIPITLMATFIAVGLGIPAGVWLNRLIENRTEKEKTKNILSLLTVELATNLSNLNYWKSTDKEDIELGTLGTKLNIENWGAFSEGGELEWIKNRVLRHNLSMAYHHIKAVQNYSEKYYDLIIIPGRGIPSQSINRMFIRLDLAVDKAIYSIDRVLKVLEKLKYIRYTSN